MKQKQVHYWAAQEQRWHDKWLESQQMIDELEGAISQIEALSLQHITDEAVRAQITKIVDVVWRGAR
jgi:hypothetical protein